jgi:thioredoxin-related protein
MFSKATLVPCKRLALVLLFLIAGQPSLLAAEGAIPAADNLTKTGQLARQLGVPTVVFVSREACPYCRTLRDQILLPMQHANKFANRAILMEISLDRVDPLTGFENKQITAQAFGDFYQAGITPTLLFLDPEGREISRRLVGISNLELYGHYLQKSIDEALLAMRSGQPEG